MKILQRLDRERLVANEMAQYRTARGSNDLDKAWRALERAHIISQPVLGLHLSNHWTMLGFAAYQSDWREAAGQIFRLALAPLGALTRRNPVGNTGRSNVSAFKAMPIPADLASQLNERRK